MVICKCNQPHPHSPLPGEGSGVRLMGMLFIVLCLSLGSCSEKDDEWDPYYNWEARNAEWFAQVADTARTAIAQAKRQYGTAWEDHCEWRMYKSLWRSADAPGKLTDSICVRILPREPKAEGDTISPKFTDKVRLNFRGWTMATEYTTEKGTREKRMAVFSQTYYGDYNPKTAAPQTMEVSGVIEGFSTALQYMVRGDDWMVYIPQQLAYEEKASNAIPAYSTLLYRLSIIEIYEAGQTVPDWK